MLLFGRKFGWRLVLHSLILVAFAQIRFSNLHVYSLFVAPVFSLLCVYFLNYGIFSVVCLFTGLAKTFRSARTAFASELGAQGPLVVLVSYYQGLGFS